MFRFFFIILFYLSFLTTYSFSDKVNKIDVNGNDRISKETIMMFSSVSINDDVDENFIAPTIIEIDNIADLKDEQFGPILHIVRFKSNEMDALIENINDSGFGLTMGIHTRVEKRADIFSDKCNVGNIYINRDMVGAVVGSQPFGGQNLSGSGYKAGGPNYLLQFLNEKVVSKNSVAFGGNTELLNIQED